ncbi:uncharacterized protein BDR25DRAFT_301204 [Lindgomyces ingoldianus]|uniref:Uncharacterized protein n=1 Tax=Lindgomyces ingoldianus TaxID=673940 RepID=A0ACB6R5Z0_9PLEO|nr:uncharacterized protein BDR25DRAFT_301204 [Lindgomyces ingoldianus]KAF2474480.1 hypothetical protein BDR25DRAFT_301204 [Lindgomyces ingoldianus]
MCLRSLTLGALFGLHAIVALASPRGIIPLRPSYANTTQPTPTSTASICDSKCSVEYPQISALQWIPETQVVYTTSITVATMLLEIVMSANTTLFTRTGIAYNDPLPSDYNFLTVGTNVAGTAMVTFPVPQSDGMTFYSRVAYPTPFLDYSWEYHWQGVLQTHNKAFEPSCATATPEPSEVPLREHPEYPQPKGELSPGRFDPFGTSHVPIWGPYKDEPDALFFQVAFPSESAFSSCESVNPSTPLPTEYTTAKYVTVTTTLYGNRTYSATAPGVIIQPSETGWEVTTTGSKKAPQLVGIEKTATGFETTEPWGGRGSRVFSSGIQAQASPTHAPAQFAAVPTPVYTLVPTVVDGQSTTIPAFILPGSSATATIGQTVMINSQPTVLSAPSAVLTIIPTTVNGVATSVSIYLIGGTSTATPGQTVTIDGSTTVLSNAPTSAAGPQATNKPSSGGVAERWKVSWNAVLVGVSAFALAWL